MNLRPSGYEPDELPDCSTPLLEMGYGRFAPWSERPVSNRRPSAWKADALPTELLSLSKSVIVVADQRICQYNSTCNTAKALSNILEFSKCPSFHFFRLRRTGSPCTWFIGGNGSESVLIGRLPKFPMERILS